MHKIDELQCSLEKASEDDQNHVYMVHSQLKVCEFDKNMTYILVYNEENDRKCDPTRQTRDGIKRQKERHRYKRIKRKSGGIVANCRKVLS